VKHNSRNTTKRYCYDQLPFVIHPDSVKQNLALHPEAYSRRKWRCDDIFPSSLHITTQNPVLIQRRTCAHEGFVAVRTKPICRVFCASFCVEDNLGFTS